MSLNLSKVVQKDKAGRTLHFVSSNNTALHYGPVFLFLGVVRHDLQKGVGIGNGNGRNFAAIIISCLTISRPN